MSAASADTPSGTPSPPPGPPPHKPPHKHHHEHGHKHKPGHGEGPRQAHRPRTHPGPGSQHSGVGGQSRHAQPLAETGPVLPVEQTVAVGLGAVAAGVAAVVAGRRRSPDTAHAGPTDPGDTATN